MGFCFLNHKCGLIVAQHALEHWRLGRAEMYYPGRVVSMHRRLVPSTGQPTCQDGVRHGLCAVVISHVHYCYVSGISTNMDFRLPPHVAASGEGGSPGGR